MYIVYTIHIILIALKLFVLYIITAEIANSGGNDF